jgi:hypothetical protein
MGMISSTFVADGLGKKIKNKIKFCAQSRMVFVLLLLLLLLSFVAVVVIKACKGNA